MPLSDKSNHLGSDQHKNKTKQQHIWCEDCGKYISDKTRHFQSETHTLSSQNNQISQDKRRTQSAPAFAFGNGVKVIVNEEKYVKLKINPTENLEEQNNNLLRTSFFAGYKYQLSYLAKFSKLVNGEEIVFHKWVISDFNYNHTNHTDRAASHNTLMQKLDDEQLEGSGFVLNRIVNVILEIYKVNDIQASSYIELPEKFRNNKSIINIKIDDQFCFLWCVLKVKVILNFENLNKT